MSFPVWRELKLSTPTSTAVPHPAQTYNVLSRLKGIETLVFAQEVGGPCSYNVLSRLKGIETRTNILFQCRLDLIPYNVLSRLKGIETLKPGPETQVATPYNVLSRLKGIETQVPWLTPGSLISYNVLSRLKGIETFLATKVGFVMILTMSFPVWRESKLFHSLNHDILRVLQCPFPFEGNWNSIRSTHTLKSWLTMSFPVWRELKLRFVRVPQRSLLIQRLTMSFPVWRELKHLPDFRYDEGLVLTMSFPVWRELKLCRSVGLSRGCMMSYNVLSRLKGIETQPWHLQLRFSVSYNVLSRLKGIETSLSSWRELHWKLYLTMSFPVWRELKPTVEVHLIVLFHYLQCPFPFEGNWNSVGSAPSITSLNLQCPFPFEGNWNTLWFRIIISLNDLQCPFPFEGNWNREIIYYQGCVCHALQCPFPFEGNWNTLPRHSGYSCHLTYNVLSRLKGIETILPLHLQSFCGDMPYNVLSRLKGIETLSVVGSRMPFQWHPRLTMSFPVWRELKLLCEQPQPFRYCLQCPFPFEGNWNKYDAQPALVSAAFGLQCPFPFEGNWNTTGDFQF